MKKLTILGIIAIVVGILFTMIPEHRTMNFYTDITEESAAVLGEALNNLEAGDTLDINISSPGGGFTITSELLYRISESPATINVHVRSLAASGAALLMCAADNVYIKKHSVILFHTIRTISPDGRVNIITEKNADDPVTWAILQLLYDNLDLCIKKGLLNKQQLERVKQGEDVIIPVDEDMVIEQS
jgi:hypothetical protein